jgi:hypothetical protein
MKFILTIDKACTSGSTWEPLRVLDKFLKPFPLLLYKASPNSSPTADKKLFGSLKFAFVLVTNKSAISA